LTQKRAAPWCLAGASVAGSSHTAGGVPCQDRHCTRIAEDRDGAAILIIAVADGAGSASQAEAAAELAVQSFVNAASYALKGMPLASASPDAGTDWMRAARQSVLDAAATSALAPRDYACTFAACVVGTGGGLAVQIGDGVIVWRTAGQPGWTLAMQPQKGEYRNETRFLTDADADACMLSCQLPAGLSGVAVCSDGLEDLCMDRAAGTIFAPFFDAVSATILAASETQADELPTAMARYLASDAANAVSDDDKTLVVAVRLPDQPVAP